MSPSSDNVYPIYPLAPAASENLPFSIGNIGDPWGMAQVPAFMPADATETSQHPLDGGFPGTDPNLLDPNLWISQAPSYLPPAQGTEAATLTDEALGLWSFAPSTFGWVITGVWIDVLLADSVLI